MSLSTLITQKIKQHGPMRFRDFMEDCLYYPELGYYQSVKNIIGTSGDFYTSPHLTPAFGAMVARQLQQMWQITGSDNFTIVEYGAGSGVFCYDILKEIKISFPKFYEAVQYGIIEKSEFLQQAQRVHLPEKVSWYNNLYELPEITGCILSNELVDNFAVHQVVMQQQQLMEVFVDFKDNFTELLKPASAELLEYFSELKVQLPEGFRAEVNLDAKHWITEISNHLKKGFLLTIDYGGSSAELYRPAKRNGSLVCYKKHQVFENPYQDIGQQDITAHVNFSALQYFGEKNKLTTCGLTNQANFLLALGFKPYLLQLCEQEKDLQKALRQQAFLTHTLLVDMGEAFKVLVQSKGIAGNFLLRGFSDQS